MLATRWRRDQSIRSTWRVCDRQCWPTDRSRTESPRSLLSQRSAADLCDDRVCLRVCRCEILCVLRCAFLSVLLPSAQYRHLFSQNESMSDLDTLSCPLMRIIVFVSAVLAVQLAKSSVYACAHPHSPCSSSYCFCMCVLFPPLQGAPASVKVFSYPK